MMLMNWGKQLSASQKYSHCIRLGQQTIALLVDTLLDNLRMIDRPVSNCTWFNYYGEVGNKTSVANRQTI